MTGLFPWQYMGAYNLLKVIRHLNIHISSCYQAQVLIQVVPKSIKSVQTLSKKGKVCAAPRKTTYLLPSEEQDLKYQQVGEEVRAIKEPLAAPPRKGH